MLINLRNALMAGKRLPYDAEVEYLKCTGTSSAFPYIDTGIVGAGDVTFAASVYRSTNITNECAIGAYGSSLRYWASYFFGNTYFLGMGSKTNNTTNAPTGTWMLQELKAENGKFNLYSNGSLAATCATSTFDTNQNIYIGCMNYNGGASFYFRGRFGFVRIYSNGVLVRDYIPVRKGTVGYLYDRVSGKLFGNAGTGDFVLGPDVVPVEYIESSGTQYIETGVYGNESTHVTIVAASKAFTSSSDVTDTAQGIFGYATAYSLRVWGKSFHSTYGLLSFGFKQGWTNGSQIYAQSSEQYLTIELRPYGNTSCRMYIDDTASIRSAYGGAFTTSGTLWLGKIGGGSTYNGVNMRIKSFSIEGKCNLVPIRVGSGSTWEGAMMDVLTRRIYRNAGTGAFTYGNDLKYPIPAE